MDGQLSIPRHIAIIMDGNGRWAAARGREREYGHANGTLPVKESIKGCIRHGVQFLTLFAFSSENWNRPSREVEALMQLLGTALRENVDELQEQGVKLRLLGDLGRLDIHLQNALHEAVEQTQGGTTLTLCVALNYGARQEILRAVERYMSKCEEDGKAAPLTEDLFSRYLDTAGIPDPDLLIRTSGESRLSNFLLWQMAYTELLFLPIYWPDFREEHLYSAIKEYSQRDRRFGAI